MAYLPAILKSATDSDLVKRVADEVALVAYESLEVYNTAKATPEGKIYSDLHWTAFDKERTKLGGSIKWSPGDSLVVDQAYDAIGRNIDWQAGHSTLWIGVRKKGTGEEFVGFWDMFFYRLRVMR